MPTSRFGNQNNFQLPIFGPATPNYQLYDDVDLSDIFGDEDNLFNAQFQPNFSVQLAQVQAQAHSLQAAAALAQTYSASSLTAKLAQAQQAQSILQSYSQNMENAQDIITSSQLPLGKGVRTPWHYNALPHSASLQQHPFFQAVKKQKLEESTEAQRHFNTQMETNEQQNEHPYFQSVAGSASSTNAEDTDQFAARAKSSALSERLGYFTFNGQVAVPRLRQKQNASETQQHQPLPQSTPQTQNDSHYADTEIPMGHDTDYSNFGMQLHQDQPMAQETEPAQSDSPISVPLNQLLSHVNSNTPNTTALQSNSEHLHNAFASNFQVASSAAENGKKKPSQASISKRRERNRIHAQRSRVRKKFLLESLQEEVNELQKENAELRMIVKEKLPEHAEQIIHECCVSNPLLADDPDVDPDEKKDAKPLVKSDYTLIRSLSVSQRNFILTDPRLLDNPIVFASQGFYDLTGYPREQVLGRNCRFLQGKDTDKRAVDIIRIAVANGTDANVCLLNYKADGTPFWNQLFIASLKDSNNNIVNYVGVQCPVDPTAGAALVEEMVDSVMPLEKDYNEKDDDDGASDH